MIDPLTALGALHRPTLLVKAAKIASHYYSREKTVRRLLGKPTLPGRKECILRLMELEREMDVARQHKNPAYSVARHVELLTALMHEAQTPRAVYKERSQVKASATADFLRAI